jgi:gliding motility-associated-like protein
LNDIQIYTSAIDTFATALTGRYQLIVNDGFCNSLKSAFIPIKQLDIPIYTFSYNEYTCKNGKLAITTDAIDNSNIHLLWNFGDGDVFNKANPISHTYDSNGKYIIKLAVTNDYCPKYEYELIGDTVKVISPLSPSIFTLFLLADQDTLLTLKKVDSGYTNYNWNPIVYLSNPFIANPIFRSETSIQYTLSRIDPITECMINDIYNMEVSDDIVVSLPKAFTPNGDNLNDKLKIQFGAGLKSFNILKIFNRFGKLVFQTTNINEGWDGKFNGIDQDMDAYTYFIDYITYKDEHITKTGSVILLR